MPQKPWEEYQTAPGKKPWEEYGGTTETAQSPAGTLAYKQETARQTFEANKPIPTAATGLQNLGESIVDRVSGLVKGATAGPATLQPNLGEKATVSGLVHGIADPVTDYGSSLLAKDPDAAARAGGRILTDTAPALYGAGSLVKAGVRAAAPVLDSTAERLYESALKPAPRQNSLADVQKMVRTGLDERIPVNEGGVKRLNTLQKDLNTQVADTINAGNTSVPPINKFRVASRLGDAANRFRNQVNPTADLNRISDVGNEFLGTQPNDILPVDAQALKQGTYQQLKSRAFGELKSAEVEGQKQLARGLKEEIESRFPDVKDLNARNSGLFNLQPDLEAAVNRSRNRNIIGFGTPMVSAGTAMATGSLPAAAGIGALKELIGSPVIKSRVAIALARLAGH